MNRAILMLCGLFVMSLATSADAELIAYEPFNFADIGGHLMGKSGGYGFDGEWKKLDDSRVSSWLNYDVAQGSLSYFGLPTEGNHIETGTSGVAAVCVDLANPISRDDTAIKYLSFLARPDLRTPSGFLGVSISGGGAPRNVLIGRHGEGTPNNYVIESLGGGSRRVLTEYHPDADETSFFVVKAEFQPGKDVFTVYVNPIPGQPEPATGVVKDDLDVFGATGLGIASTAAFSVDEIRWGDSYADVTPTSSPLAVELIRTEQPGKFVVGTSEPSPFPDLAWTDPDFDDNQWSVAVGGIGYGPDVQDRNVTTILDDMEGNYNSVYLRHAFPVDAPEQLLHLVVELDYDDAFIAYVNGVEVAGAGVGTQGASHPFDARARNSRSGSAPHSFTVDLSSFPNLLQAGHDNILAIQGINRRSSDRDFVLSQIRLLALASAAEPSLQAGDADQDYDFDQLDLVQVQIAGKYLSGEPATWGDGDWNGAPGGLPGNPPEGDELFNQLDIVAAQQAATYLAGPYAMVRGESFIAVPEPNGLSLLTISLLGFSLFVSPRRRNVAILAFCSLVGALVVIGPTAPSYAELIAYEAFDYADIGEDLVQKDGGIGFQRSWGSSYGEARVLQIADGSLSFGGLETEGNRYASASASLTWLSRSPDELIAREETATKYLGLLLRPARTQGGDFFGVTFDGRGTDVHAGNPGQGASLEYVIENFGNDGTQDQFSSGMPITANQTALLVVKAEFTPGIDTFTLYVNPIPGLPEPLTGTVKDDVDVGGLTRIFVGGRALFSGDELRWGDTFADVVPAPLVSTVELIGTSEPWSYFPGTEEPSPFPELAWTTPGFDDSQWAVNREGVGYGADTEARGVVTVLEDMQDNYNNVYMRHSLTAENPEAISDLVLQLDYDDAFIAYINGVEVARSNVRMPGEPEPIEPRSVTSRRGTGVNNFLIELDSFPDLLQAGEDNVLAIQGINRRSSDTDFLLSQIQVLGLTPETQPALQAGDADQDLDFDQLDLVQVQIAGKYLSGEPATWGEGDWNGAPGGFPGNPPEGDGLFNQLDIVAAQQAATYLAGPYAALRSEAFIAVPEPNGLSLLAIGLLGFSLFALPRRRNLASLIFCSLVGALVAIGPTTPSYAELIAYEAFDYAEVGDDLLGKTGGTGLAGEWMRVAGQWGFGASRTYDVAEGSLSFGGILTSGNRIRTDEVQPFASLGRALADPIAADDTRTMYFSFLIQPEESRPGRWFGPGLIGGDIQRIQVQESNSIFTGALETGEYVIENFGGSLSHSSGVPWAEGETALLVVKAELMPGIDTFTLYTNPIPGLPEPVTGTVKQDLDVNGLSAIALASDGAYSVDELRWGDTFADVVPAPPVSAVELIGTSESWSYFPGTEEPSPFPELAWTTPGFDDSQWAGNQEGVGYGADTEARGVVTVLEDMQDNYNNVYMRHSFTAENPEAISDLALQLDYDDAFIAYINGVEVARSNVRMPGEPEPIEPRSVTSRRGTGVNNFLIELDSFPDPGLLQGGENNVLAIQGINRRSSDRDFLLSQIQVLGLTRETQPALQAGDADQDLDFDQLDLVQVQIAGKYLSGEPATWGEGDWNGAPGGFPGNPPEGDGLFNQLDIVAAQQAATYLAGPYAMVRGEASIAVPEPNGLLLLAIGLLAFTRFVLPRRRNVAALTFLLLVGALVVMTLPARSYAELIAYEPFDYSDVGTAIGGKNGGLGLRRTWVPTYGLPADQIEISEGSLTFPGLKSGGNRVGSLEPLFPNCQAAARGLDTRISRDETTTKYLSALVRPEGTLGRGPFSGVGFVGFDGSSDDIIAAGSGRQPNYFIERTGDEQTGPQSDVPPVSRETALLVMKAELTPANDTFTLYVNPTPGTPEPPSGTVFDGVDIGNLNGILLTGCGAHSIDELRFGDTFADVTPAEQATGREFGIVVPNVLEREEGSSRGPSGTGFPIKVQELLPASEFASLPDTHRWITALAFRPDESAALPRSTTFADAEWRLSTTPKGLDDLSLEFTENVGPDELVVFERKPHTLSAAGGTDVGPGSFDFTWGLDRPFYYDPNKGNLLVEFRSNSGYVDEAPLFDTDSDSLGSVGLYADSVNAQRASLRYDQPVYEITFADRPVGEEGGLIVNSGFELVEETTDPNFPQEYGHWGGDTSEIVAAQNGITPIEGAHMLSFIDTFPTAPSNLDKSDVYQLVDISPYADLLEDETLALRATAHFNRIPGGAETDTRFDITIEAQQGDPSGFPSTTELDESVASIFTDADPATWEMLSVDFVPPAGTDFIALKVRSVEDIRNDLDRPEFDGHYVDAVTLTVLSALQAGDADQDLDFDQLDLVQVQIGGKYLSSQPATWGEGDWNGAPGGYQGNPPGGDGLFNQLDIVAAQQGAAYLMGPYAAVVPGGRRGDSQTSLVYDANTGELAVDAPADVELTSINIDSAAGIFIGDAARNLGGSFDNDAENNIFKATFGSSFGSISFGQVAQTGLSQTFVLNDLAVVGSLAGGGALGDVDLIYIPEPSSAVLLALSILLVGAWRFAPSMTAVRCSAAIAHSASALGAMLVTATASEPALGREFKIVVPNRFAETEGNKEGGTGFGFGLRTQEVFLAEDFDALPPSHRWITGVAMRPDENASLPRSSMYGDIQYRLSTTTLRPDDLSNVFAENVGPDETLVFDRSRYTISARDIPDPFAPGPRSFDYVTEFDTPFYYDPTKGANLLLEFRSESGYLNVGPHFDTHDDFSGIVATDAEATESTSRFDSLVRQFIFAPVELQAGDANQDLDFDQLDLVQVQIAGKYLSGQSATWGQGDWNGAPGGYQGHPPQGDGLFNQLDIVAAQQAAVYLTGPYAAHAFARVPEPNSIALLVSGLLAFAVPVLHRGVRR